MFDKATFLNSTLFQDDNYNSMLFAFLKLLLQTKKYLQEAS